MKQSARINLNHFHSFYWVAKTGSFTGAGRVLGLPKSTLSQQLRVLESRLGTRLIERTTRRLALTELGQLFLVYCERVMSEAEDAERAVVAYTAEPRGLLRVGAPVTFARTYLAPLLPKFCRRYPAVKLELVIQGGRLDPVENLLDVVIRLGRIADSSYMIRKLGSIEQGLYASREYLRQRETPMKPEELNEHSVIATSRSPNGSLWRLLDSEGREKQVQFEPRVSTGDPVIAQVMVREGLGIGQIPKFAAKEDASLVEILPEWEIPQVEFFALYPARQLTPLKLKVFLDELEAGLAFGKTDSLK